jgi:hypothetical protein
MGSTFGRFEQDRIVGVDWDARQGRARFGDIVQSIWLDDLRYTVYNSAGSS